MSSSIPASTPGKIWQPPTAEELQPELPAYEILGLLGRGGMGAVYKARQKSLNREVAIKVLPPMAAEDDGTMHFADRFKAEAQAMARLNHPGIVAVHDAGETPGGLLYFVMEMVQGTDVSQMIRSAGRLPPEHVHAIAAHVCDALAYAHANGLIHRDIKPANIMVDTQGRVKVADFGLAKAVDAQTGFTQSNMAVGTPDFVAPEALIPGMPVDGRADLYAVGVMLYQMLTGQIPRGAWQPASVVAPGTDVRFDQIIVKAMAYDREQRHSSATELRQHLDTLLMPAVPAPDLQRYSSAQMPRSADAPVRQSAAAPSERKTSFPTRPPSPGGFAAKKNEADKNEADKNVRSTSRTPLFIGIGAAAAIGIGAFVMFSGREKAKPSSPLSPLSGAPVVTDASKPAQGIPSGASQVRTTLTPPVKVSEPPKPEPKPVVVAKAPEPPKPAALEPKQEAPKPTMAAQSSPLSPLSGTSVPATTTTAKPPAPSQTALAGASAPPSAPLASPGTAQGTERATLPAELAALDAQFIKLQKERVTAPFEADVAKLNTSYLGGIGKKIAEEKAAGHLDAILALEAEKQTVERVFNSFSAGGATAGNELKTRSTNPVPETDDEKTPASLKALRTIYREQFAKISATRAANLKALTDPLDKRLAQMEVDFTKADRLADAKVVRGYREVLSESGPLSPLSGTSGPVAANPPAATAPGAAQGIASGALREVRTTLAPAAVLALKDGFTNTLGMKFLPVKGTDVLFCIHETRRQDYAAYAAEVPGVDESWKNQQRDGIPCGDKDDHPVVGVSWEDSQKFCEWLSKKEGKTYRLPTDEEWSIAVGLGRKEKHGNGITPAMLNQKEQTEFPWGGDYPPKTKDQAGNYADESWHEKFPMQPWIEKYSDGFPTTAPVMSFKANKAGLYDMGGNVWEWVDDWWNAAQKERVLRGASFTYNDRDPLLSSHRHSYTLDHRNSSYGFRVVLVVSGG